MALDPSVDTKGHIVRRWGLSGQRDPRNTRRQLVITRADVVERVQEWGLTEESSRRTTSSAGFCGGSAQTQVARSRVGVQGRDLFEKVLHRDLPLLGGPRLHRTARRAVQPRRRPAAATTMLTRVTRGVRHRLLDTSPGCACVPTATSTEGRVYYTGPRGCAARRHGSSSTSRPTSKSCAPPGAAADRSPYPDTFPRGGSGSLLLVRGAFRREDPGDGERSRPRDLYDIVNLFDATICASRAGPRSARRSKRSAQQRGSRPDRGGLQRFVRCGRSWSPSGATCSATSCRFCLP